MSIAYDACDYSHNAYAAPTVACQLAPSTEGRSGLSWLMFSFQGRTTRSQYWATLILGYFGFGVYSAMTAPILARQDQLLLDALVFIPAVVLFFWSMVAIQVKRWHDRGKSGWWCFIGIVPYLGALWKFVELGCLSGTSGQNDYGPDPRAKTSFEFSEHRDSPQGEAPKRQLIVPRRVATH